MSVTSPVTDSAFVLDDLYARELPELQMPWQAAAVPDPRLVVINGPLAVELGLDPELLAAPDGVAVLAGAAIPPGATPVAMAYAGHQFGGYSPRLGDGRAVLLGEVVVDARHVDVHLKGSGRTPFARGGDGKATLASMLREYLMAESMSALGVPTTRALAVATTGEEIRRERGMEPGAVLTRTASSHLRVGTFQYAASLDQPGLLERLADHAISRHHPHLAAAGEARHLGLFAAVLEAQASLVAQWMLVGFIHGVMNTDNMSISGETIDYGPCAFMDTFDPSTVFSSIDHGGRYAYGNQPKMAHWNLVRLAEAMLPLLADDTDTAVSLVTEVLETFPQRYDDHWVAGMRTKLGFVSVVQGDRQLGADLLDWMHAGHADFTSVFRALARSLRGDAAPLEALANSVPATAWLGRWRDRLAVDGRDAAAVADGMDAVNPLYIPRNHLVEGALGAATEGDLGPFEELLAVTTDPYTRQAGAERHAEPAPASWSESHRTFCGT